MCGRHFLRNLLILIQYFSSSSNFIFIFLCVRYVLFHILEIGRNVGCKFIKFFIMVSNFDTIIKVVVELINSFEKGISWRSVLEIFRVVVDLIDVTAISYERHNLSIYCFGGEKVIFRAKSNWCILPIHPLNNRIIPPGALLNLVASSYMPFIHAAVLNFLIMSMCTMKLVVI
jgi:hypothetical protein